MPTGYSQPGKKKMQAWIDPRLLDELDALCVLAGRISRRDALERCWPALLAELRRQYRIGDPPADQD